MVSIRKVREEFKVYRKQIQDLATVEVQRRADALLDKLITLSIYNANKRGQNSRVSVDDVRLAYMEIIDIKEVSKQVISEEDDEDFGDWNE
tara:strand:+ start:1365 stop:1637 length:273 start_codon:yes stop_codon:yes gene_type:complete